ncbi:hypothetical protein N0V88_006345 [Collariella sp. IMI 366227]|nr:hypothetical protein N0V88_006345 [Collariella sp. IMI 366227]
MSRLRSITAAIIATSSSPSYITPGPDAPWTQLGSDKPDTLRTELEKLYWEGVTAELENIIRTLQAWDTPEFASAPFSDQRNDFVHGFDTFIDQVSQGAREFAIRAGRTKDTDWSTYENALRAAVTDRKAEYVSKKLKASVRKRANISLAKLDKHEIPRFQPLHCARPGCGKVITASMFKSQAPEHPSVICEDCYWQHYYGNKSYIKTYKHCVLQEAITFQNSTQLCHCKDVPRFDDSGKPLSLFPVDKDARHIGVGESGGIQCSLLKLDELVVKAKYIGTLKSVGMKNGRPSSMLFKELDAAKAGFKSQTGSTLKDRRKSASAETTASAPKHFFTASGPTEAEADTDIPLFLRKFAKKDPFGDVHMALRVGPLVIENGVAQTVWEQTRNPSRPKRYKAIMKQVVGAPFTGIMSEKEELHFVEQLVAICDQAKHTKTPQDKAVLGFCVDVLVPCLKRLMQPQLDVYLDSITARLLNPTTNLTWNPSKNISKHIWAFPFDSWSFISHHLTRDPFLYPLPFTTTHNGSFTITNHSLDHYPAAPHPRHHATHPRRRRHGLTPLFHNATAWLSSPLPLLTQNPVLARVPLGGIHRAQPFSHYFSLGRNARYFLSPWESLPALSKSWTRGTSEPNYANGGKFGVVVGDPVQYPASSDIISGTRQGSTDVVNRLKAQAALCPNQKFALVGYSQGAGVMHSAADKIPLNLYSRIKALVMFGDAYNRLGLLGRFPIGLRDKALQVCAPGDPVCDRNADNCTYYHLTYIRPNYINAAVDYIVQRSA